MSPKLTRRTMASGRAGPARNMASTGSLAWRGFQENHSSEPGLRIVGIRMSSESCDTVAASSTQAMSMPSMDLIDSGLERSPANRNSEPLRPRIAVSVER